MVRLHSEPRFLDIGPESVSAFVDFDADSGGLIATVIVSKLPDSPQLTGEALDARLIAADGETVEPISRPHGTLVEVGGGLGVAANATFAFPAAAVPPAGIFVDYRAARLEFRLVPTVSGEGRQ